jgi:hypothetical protein
MTRLAIVLALVAACSGSAKKDTTPPQEGSAGSDGPALYAKKLAVSWGIQQTTGQADVFLQATDETGKQTSYPLGTYPGVCQVITPAPDMKALTGVSCTNGDTGTELDAVVSGDEVIVLKGATTQGAAPDPMAREEVTRIKAPPGAKIQIGA